MTAIKLTPSVNGGTEYWYTEATSVFSFPNNPNVVNGKNKTKTEILDVPYRSLSGAIDSNTVSQKVVTINGTLYGSDRYTNYRKMSKYVYSAGLKKLWINTDRFIYVYGGSMQDNLSGTRQAFIDYVVTFVSPIPFWYSCETSGYALESVSKTNTAASTVDDAMGNGFTNTGSAPCHVYKWTITNNGDSNITTIVLAQGAATATATNKITWTGTLSNGGTVLEIWLFYKVGDELVLFFPCLSSDRTAKNGSITVVGTDGPQIISGGSNESFSSNLTWSGAVNSGAVIKAEFWKTSDYVV